MATIKNYSLKKSRKVHRWIGSAFFVFFFIISTTGFLLGWKSWFNTTVYKNQSKSKVEKNMQLWIPLDSLKTIAINQLSKYLPENSSNEIDRIDIRPEKSYAVFQFKNKYAVTLSLSSGIVQQIDKKNSNIILKIHEGSLVDDWLGTEFFKKTYITVIGISFFVLTLTGFWLWYRSRHFKKSRNN